MPQKPKKKRIILWVLLILLIVTLVAVAVPIASLYVQYRKISYAPSVPVERSDTYVLPDYPEVIPGSEGITDYPETTEAPSTEAPATEPPATEAPATEESSTAVTDAATAAPATEAPEIDLTPPETLAPVVNDSPSTEAPDAWVPKYDESNSFSNSPYVISVYGDTPIYKVKQKDPNVVNILLLGTDSRDITWDRGRSDTMIVLSYNKKTGEMNMVSLLRDLLVPIEGCGWDRINTAYFYDGAGLAVNTVNQLFGLDIQSFVVIDLNGAKDFINYIGGITLTLSESEAREAGVEYSPEPVFLDGSNALRHMRNRTSDSDFGRTERQREVIVAVLTKILTEKSLTEILDITKHAMGMVKTNISATSLMSLATSIVGNAGKLTVRSQSVPYNDLYQFAWYQGKAIIYFDIQSSAKRVQAFLYK